MTESPTAPAQPGALMAAEIAEQPAVLRHVLEEAPEAIEQVAARVRAAAPRMVLLAARGTSDHACIYAKYLVETVLGLPAGLVSTSVYTTYGTRPRLDGVLWIVVSQSGGSPDLVASTTAAREAGALTVALTNVADSPLAAAAELTLPMLAGPETSVAATKTYTASLLNLWLLITAIAGRPTDAAAAVPDHAEAALIANGVDDVIARYRFVDKLVTTSRGYAYPTARESALKLMETCYLSAHAFSGADLLHGPLAMIDADRPVVTIVPEGPGGDALVPVLERLRERGADVCLVAPPSVVGSDVRIDLPAAMDEQFAPIAQIIPLQRLALGMATGRGYDPDRPRGLHKVTETF
ncbi:MULTISPECIES: SIS domain-containing protein [unclassified Janibacter]|uniref:SIS domain-containing protein n=1 Tax=unclassified Janibacter TaxID=2649294 RepID=UPI003D07CF98